MWSPPSANPVGSWWRHGSSSSSSSSSYSQSGPHLLPIRLVDALAAGDGALLLLLPPPWLLSVVDYQLVDDKDDGDDGLLGSWAIMTIMTMMTMMTMITTRWPTCFYCSDSLDFCSQCLQLGGVWGKIIFSFVIFRHCVIFLKNIFNFGVIVSSFQKTFLIGRNISIFLSLYPLIH